MNVLLAISLDNLLTPFKDVLDTIIASLPRVLGFIGFVILAWIVIKVFLWIVRKALNKTKIDEWSEKLKETEIFGNTTINVVLTTVILGVLKWLLILIFVMSGANIFGVESISDAITSFFAYLPRLLSALAIFVVGLYIGTIVKKAINSMFKSLEISGGNLVGNIAFYLIVVFLGITAFDQAGVDTSVIKSNLTLIIGSIVLAFTIAFGLGSKDIIKRLLFGYYSRKNLEIGKRIKIDSLEGVIESIDNICVVILTEKGKVVLPVQDVVDSKVEVLN
ncbi:mechanosensitive ion channel family protein [Polaribacter sp.]|uniref:mechanosensitive ion channel family protein n=1 Tax=Polaribacter sp. TaxID=1920175 RepID=UPI003EF5922E